MKCFVFMCVLYLVIDKPFEKACIVIIVESPELSKYFVLHDVPTSNFLNLYVCLMFSYIVYTDVMNIKVLSEYGKGLQDTGTIH